MGQSLALQFHPNKHAYKRLVLPGISWKTDRYETIRHTDQ